MRKSRLPIVMIFIHRLLYLKVEVPICNCGKAYGDTCKTHEECSSKQCHTLDGYCLKQTRVPTSNEDTELKLSRFFIITIFLLIIILGWCCYKHYKNPKDKRYIVCMISVMIILCFKKLKSIIKYL